MNWLKVYSELTSIHGMRWHLCVKSLALKIFFVGLIVVMIVAMPTFFIYEAVDFFSQVENMKRKLHFLSEYRDKISWIFYMFTLLHII